MRRGLIAVGISVPLLVVGFVAATIRTNHQLGDQLLTDIATLRAKRIKVLRPEGAMPPRHTNGLACLASVAKSAPPSVTAFNDAKAEATVFANGEKPLSDLPEATRAMIEPLRPWVVAMRECGDAAELQWVEAVEPWGDLNPVMKSNIAMRHTALDARILLSEGHAARALQSCTEGLESTLDVSHLGLTGSIVAATAVRTLAPICAAAWTEVTPEVRKDIGPRWVLLSTRLASDAEILECDRVAGSVLVFAPYASSEARAKFPPLASPGFELSPVDRVSLPRLWGRWDASMRQLAAAKDETSFIALDHALRDWPWWLPEGSLLTVGEGYVRVHARLESARAALGVMTSIATGAPLPASATEKDGVITLPALDANNGPLSFKR